MKRWLWNFSNSSLGGALMWIILLLLVSGFGTSGWWGGWVE